MQKKDSYKNLVRSKFRTKIASLTLEARYLRDEERRYDGGSSNRGVLRWHRIDVIRREQRSTLLAYAFVRGVPYLAVESRTSRPVDLVAVRRIVASLGGKSNNETLGNAIIAWIATDRVSKRIAA